MKHELVLSLMHDLKIFYFNSKNLTLFSYSIMLTQYTVNLAGNKPLRITTVVAFGTNC